MTPYLFDTTALIDLPGATSRLSPACERWWRCETNWASARSASQSFTQASRAARIRPWVLARERGAILVTDNGKDFPMSDLHVLSLRQ